MDLIYHKIAFSDGPLVAGPALAGCSLGLLVLASDGGQHFSITVLPFRWAQWHFTVQEASLWLFILVLCSPTLPHHIIGFINVHKSRVLSRWVARHIACLMLKYFNSISLLNIFTHNGTFWQCRYPRACSSVDVPVLPLWRLQLRRGGMTQSY